MPRVNRQSRASYLAVSQTARTGTSKLRKCLDALVSDPEAACSGVNDLCCAGCGNNGELIDALCTFTLHSDVARRHFVKEGGLDALLLVGRNNQTEKSVLAALQILSCLGTCSLGQELISTERPELLQMLCDQALDRNEDRESVQHAALMILTGWAMEEPHPKLTEWFNTCAAIQQESPMRTNDTHNQSFKLNLDQPHPAKVGFGSCAVVFGSASVPATPSVTATQNHTPGKQECSSTWEPVLLNISARALQHPSIAIRKVAAQLFVAAAGESQTSMAAACERLQKMVVKATQILVEESRASQLPRFEAFSGTTPGQIMLDPAAFLRHQEQQQSNKTTCHALLNLVSELCMVGPGGSRLLSTGMILPCVIAIFESAWRIQGDDKGSSATGSSGSSGNGNVQSGPFGFNTAAWHTSSAGSMTAPFAFLQDQQTREMALDTLAAVVRSPGLLYELGKQVRGVTGPESAVNSTGASVHTYSNGHSTQGHQDTPPADEAECAALCKLHSMVRSLLRQQSAAHVRAAITLLGFVRFDTLPHPDLSADTQGQQQQQRQNDTRLAWLNLLCSIFRAAWKSEAQHEQHDAAGAQQKGHADGDVDLNMELGLGYRVLVQVLQAWKSLQEAAAPAIVQVLEMTEFKQLALAAVQHPKYLVASTAYRVVYHGTVYEQLLLAQQQRQQQHEQLAMMQQQFEAVTENNNLLAESMNKTDRYDPNRMATMAAMLQQRPQAQAMQPSQQQQHEGRLLAQQQLPVALDLGGPAGARSAAAGGNSAHFFGSTSQLGGNAMMYMMDQSRSQEGMSLAQQEAAQLMSEWQEPSGQQQQQQEEEDDSTWADMRAVPGSDVLQDMDHGNSASPPPMASQTMQTQAEGMAPTAGPVAATLDPGSSSVHTPQSMQTTPGNAGMSADAPAVGCAPGAAQALGMSQAGLDTSSLPTDTEMQDFLSVFLEPEEVATPAEQAGQPAAADDIHPASGNFTSAATQLQQPRSQSSLLSQGMKILDLSQPVTSSASGRDTLVAGTAPSSLPTGTSVALNSTAQQLQQQHADMSTMFDDWDAPQDRDEKQLLEEALELLPDLDAMQQAMLTVPANGRPYVPGLNGMMMDGDEEEDEPGLPAVGMRGGYGIPAHMMAAMQQHMMMSGNGGSASARQHVPAMSPLAMLGL